MADILTTFGTIAGYTVTLQRRGRQPGDGYAYSQASPLVQTLTLTKGASVTDLCAVEDVSPGVNQTVLAQGQAIMAAFAAIGAQVTLGDPAKPIIANPNGSGAYTRAVDLVPGTPLPPGFGVRISGTTEVVKVKLAGGGLTEIQVTNSDGAAGTIYSGLAVVDAVTPVPTGAKVQILY